MWFWCMSETFQSWELSFQTYTSFYATLIGIQAQHQLGTDFLPFCFFIKGLSLLAHSRLRIMKFVLLTYFLFFFLQPCLSFTSPALTVSQFHDRIHSFQYVRETSTKCLQKDVLTMRRRRAGKMGTTCDTARTILNPPIKDFFSSAFKINRVRKKSRYLELF